LIIMPLILWVLRTLNMACKHVTVTWTFTAGNLIL
jgi:hypothetical protein